MIHSWLTDQDIFALQPDLKVIFPTLSSKEMWCLALFTDPKSKLSALPRAQKLEIIQKDYAKDWLPDPTLEALYKDLLLTKAQRMLLLWEEKLEERSALIGSLPYNLENLDTLDDMMSKSPKIWEGYDKIKKLLEQEESTSYGGAQESLTELGLI